MRTPLLLAFVFCAAAARAQTDFGADVESAVQDQSGQARALAKTEQARAAAPVAAGQCNPRLWFGTPPDPDAPLPALDVAARVTGRDFPSVFEAWHGADNLNNAPFGGAQPLPDAPGAGAQKASNIARHDLAFFSPSTLGLKPNADCQGLSVGYTAASIPAARARRQAILAANPHAVLLAEIRWHDAAANYLPADSTWWKAGDAHQDLKGDYRLLNWSDPSFQRQVALQCRAAVQSGVFDGCMFDWWVEDAGVIGLARAVRAAIGPDALILVNANDRRPTATAADINGLYMEGFNSRFWSSDAAGWQKAEGNLEWADHALRAPQITAFEGWATNARGDLRDVQLMRAVTALSLTRSNGYVLFGDKNTDGVNDHRHDWYPFWDKGLGRPSGDAQTLPDGSVRREFSGGTVVYNPASNKTVTVRFPEARTSRATHRTSRDHVIVAGDGDIFVVPR